MNDYDTEVEPADDDTAEGDWRAAETPWTDPVSAAAEDAAWLESYAAEDEGRYIGDPLAPEVEAGERLAAGL